MVWNYLGARQEFVGHRREIRFLKPFLDRLALITVTVYGEREGEREREREREVRVSFCNN